MFTPKDLATVDEHVAAGEQHVARQREIVQQVSADPRLRELAERLLSEMEAALKQHRLHRKDVLARMGAAQEGD